MLLPSVIETLSLGACLLLHNTASGAIILTEPSWLYLLDNPQPDGRKARALRASWEDAGLFRTDRLSPQTSLSRTDTPCIPMVFCGPGGAFVVTMPAGDHLGDQLETILAPHLVSDSADLSGTVVQTCTLEVVGETYSAFELGRPISGDMTRDDARFYIIRRITETIYGTDRVATVFHAAAVAKDGRGLMLLGTSGRGKTTTALGLLNSGCLQIADDHVPTAPDGVSMLGFPSAIALKPGTWDLPEAQPFLAQPSLQTIRDGALYVTAPKMVATGETVPISALIFPEFDPDFSPDAPPELTRVPPEEVLVCAIQAGARISPGHNTAVPIVTLCNTIPAWRLRYVTSAQSVPACLSLLDP